MTKKLGSRWFWSTLVAAAILLAPLMAAAQVTTQPPEVVTPPQGPPPGPPPPPPPPPTQYPAKGPAGGTQILLGPEAWIRFGFQVQAWLNYQQALSPAGNYSLDLYL